MDLHVSMLTRLRAFEAVARHGSFKRAAEELHVTQSALSHHVRHLESELGLPLLQRLHRRIALTAQGRQLCDDCRQGFEVLGAAVRRVKRSVQDDALTVSVAPYFSARWLTPRLGRWWQRHPAIDLQLRHSYRPADFLHDRVDAGISWGPGDWPGIEATRVLTGELVAVCSPALARQAGRALRPADLPGRRLLCEFDVRHWPQWFAAAGVPVGPRLDVVVIDDSHALRQAAIDGHGVALFFRGLLQDDLRSGLLVQPFAVAIDPGCAYHLVRPRGRPVGPHLAAFMRWLQDEIAGQPLA